MLNNLGDDLKKIVLLGIGAVATTAEKCADAKDIVDSLVKKGELTVEQGKVLNEELKHNVKSKVDEVCASRKEAVMDETISKLSKEERLALKAKLEALEQDEACECDNAE